MVRFLPSGEVLEPLFRRPQNPRRDPPFFGGVWTPLLEGQKTAPNPLKTGAPPPKVHNCGPQKILSGGPRGMLYQGKRVSLSILDRVFSKK